MPDSLEKAMCCLKILKEKKPIKPVLLKIGHLTSLADYFIITSSSSIRQAQSLTKHIKQKMKKEGYLAYSIEGDKEGQWVLLDYGDVIIHIFYEPVREYYDLEGLWIDAPRLATSEAG